MAKLKKAEFSEKYRFREARKEGLVSCASCASISGEENITEAFCVHSERGRRIRIADYFCDSRSSWYTARKSLCDAFISKPLSKGVEVPVLKEGQGFLLGTQWRDPYHADANCPYVVEEARAVEETKKPKPEGDEGEKPLKFNKPEVHLVDSLKGSSWRGALRDICEMPCCESKLSHFHISHNPNGYRVRVGLKPDGSEVYIRPPEHQEHETKFNLTADELREFFDLSKFDSADEAEKHLDEGCNRIGTRDFSKAVNPVKLYFAGDTWRLTARPNGDYEMWLVDNRVYEPRLRQKTPDGKVIPLKDLDVIPDGILFGLAKSGVLPWDIKNHSYLGLTAFHVYGNIRKVTPDLQVPKGVTHFIDVDAISYSDTGNSWMYGVFGQGFHHSARAEQ